MPPILRVAVTAMKSPPGVTAWIDTWNENPRPFTWTKTADEILNSLDDYLTKVGTASQKTEQN
ncbi:hypothetical protein [Streptomyces sp. NBC_00120]|uniref:hypothetical protein n=2 Tax=unclassified Streptomyces TaxID=2593676 RepID=UPI0022528247|nr:hypothetical protein [Streptomyces sp. NBC_00120]MCX5319887.1 hypothetical protein [Streptomyces sp. NBC_00120]